MTKKERNILSIALIAWFILFASLMLKGSITIGQAIDSTIIFVLVLVTLIYAIRTADIAKATKEQANASVTTAEETRGQLKLNTFLTLLSELAESKYRSHRELIHREFPPTNTANSIKEGILSGNTGYDHIKNAIEETISSLDRIGFFLIKGDPRLKDDAPEWIWTITSQMWARTEWYVQHRKEDSRGYGKYFEELHNEAERRGFKERLKNNGSEVKEVA
jgi:hypothetical protein